MASLPTLIIIEQSQVFPPPATIGNRSLPLTFFDFQWLTFPPVQTLFFYEFPITETQFTKTIVPKLKSSLSITLQHFFHYVGSLIVFPDSSKKPEIRYVEGDSVTFTSAECNLNFNDLSGSHPRKCDKFYPLVPVLRCTGKLSGFISIPVFSVQVTLFPNRGFSIGMACHHSMGDASTQFSFLKAWTLIARSGSDELFLSNGTLPIYERLIKYPTLDESYLRMAKIENFNVEYEPPSLSGPIDKVRATFILTQSITTQLKKFVSTQLPTITYISSFTVACAYIWSCIAKSRNDELELFIFSIDCRARMDPPIPMAYVGNCVTLCTTIAKTTLLIGREGFVTAAKLLGENLHKILIDKDKLLKDMLSFEDLFLEGMPTTIIGVWNTKAQIL